MNFQSCNRSNTILVLRKPFFFSQHHKQLRWEDWYDLTVSQDLPYIFESLPTFLGIVCMMHR